MAKRIGITEDHIDRAKACAEMLLPKKAIAKILLISIDLLNRWLRDGKESFEGSLSRGEEPECLKARLYAGIESSYAEAAKTITQKILHCAIHGQWQAGKYLLETHPELRRMMDTEQSQDETIDAVVQLLSSGDEKAINKLKSAIEKAKL